MAKAIDKKYLAGLKHHTTEDGKPIAVDLEPDHILDWKDTGPSVTFVTKCGRKHTVIKKDAAKQEEKK